MPIFMIFMSPMSSLAKQSEPFSSASPVDGHGTQPTSQLAASS